MRDLGIEIGVLPTGPNNAITDVPGVLVGHTTLIYDEPRVARTGVTVVLPREDKIADIPAFAAYHSLNGNGEMTGIPWIEESGLLSSPIAITNTHQVGIVRDALVSYAVDKGYGGWFLPVVAETYDGFLNDINAFHVTKEHVYQALDTATSGPVQEGNVGGGTGMMCHEFKGGIGTSSRLAETPSGSFIVGALVQANYGVRRNLRVDGVPVGREIGFNVVPGPHEESEEKGSIIIILATDAPLLPVQCKRLAQRATIGLARAGGTGHNGSGDIFLAFATGNQPAANSESLHTLHMLPHEHINSLFEAAVESVEEAILNALCAAETMTGFRGRKASSLPLAQLQQVMARYSPGG